MKAIREISEMTREILRDVPRVRLAFLPTPLQRLENLSRSYGVDFYMKRDDLTGPEFGGNKTRKLEFVLPGLLAEGADRIVTGASVQSNWCRQTVAAGNRCGLRTVLYLYGPEIPDDSRGNLLLDRALGAEVHFVRLEPGENLYGGLGRTEGMRLERIRELEAEGHICRYLTVGAPFASGHTAYFAALAELAIQLDALNMTLDDFDCIVTPLGAGGTYAGMLTAKKLFGAKTAMYGFCTSSMHPTMVDDILKAARATAEFLKLDLTFREEDVRVDFDFGGTYDVPTPGSTRAIREVARSEGILLDPVYGAKAMSGLLDYLCRGVIARGSRILFWHTGGLPALFSGEGTAGRIDE
jgi:1-aminocyclopropane-1-carboxylate deaminase/D-cysteine desulfhydrase-like pyridoxal-dependent ACC family enzyme